MQVAPLRYCLFTPVSHRGADGTDTPGPGIRQVRKVAHGRFGSVEDVVAALQGTHSLYSTAPTQIEGVYLRCDDPDTGTC